MLSTEPDRLPDSQALVIEDGAPVDNLLSEKQQRLLTEPLYSNLPIWGDRAFLAAANVGVFYAVRQPPIVPDVFLSLDVVVPSDWRDKKNRTYLMWEFGKPPDVAIEIVSNSEGNELGSKLTTYANIRVSYYAVFDPLQQLGDTLLHLFELRGNAYEPITEYWLEGIGVGLTLWSGVFEEKNDTWLRWCDRQGQVIPTGRERADQESLRADQERLRANQAEAKAARLAEQLRSLSIDPDEIEE